MSQKIADLYADIRANTSGLEAGLKRSKGLLDGFGGALVKAGAVAGVIAKVGREVYEFGREGASLDRIRQSSYKLAEGFSSNMGLIVAAVKQASFNTISEYDIMTSASKAMLLGIGGNAKDLANLMEVAALRGRAMGIDATKAFDDIITGVGRKSAKILDNIGIIVDAQSAYKSYASEVGKSVTDLTEFEERQAILNVVLEQGNKMLAAQGGLTFDVASAYERAGVALKEYLGSKKEEIAFAIVPFITTTEENRAIQQARVTQALKDTTQTYGDYVRAEKSYYATSSQYITERGDLVERIYLEEGGYKEELIRKNALLSESEFLLERSGAKVATRYGEVSGAINVTSRSTENLTEALAAEMVQWDLLDAAITKTAKTKAQKELTTMFKGLIAPTELAPGIAPGIAQALGLITEEQADFIEQEQFLTEAGLIMSDMLFDQEGKLSDLARQTELTIAEIAGMTKEIMGIPSRKIDIVYNIIFRYLGYDPKFFTQIGGVPMFAPPRIPGINAQHGGSFIIPSGYPSDTFPIMGSSSERVNITPAGNKMMDSGMINELVAMRQDIQDLPRAIRDAVLMVG